MSGRGPAAPVSNVASPDGGLGELIGLLFQAHPWHGVSPETGDDQVFNSFVEIVPTDPVKYELDKATGHLRLDRPQRYSNLCPTLYGFVPQTYCGDQVAARCMQRTGHDAMKGDGDPLDICILTEKTIAQGNLLVHARPIGGFRMIDDKQADDKIVAVLEADLAFGNMRTLADCPKGVIDRLRHYFLTYKLVPGDTEPQVRIAEIYDHDEAREVIRLSRADYRDKFGEPSERVARLRQYLAGGGVP